MRMFMHFFNWLIYILIPFALAGLFSLLFGMVNYIAIVQSVAFGTLYTIYFVVISVLYAVMEGTEAKLPKFITIK